MLPFNESTESPGSAIDNFSLPSDSTIWEAMQAKGYSRRDFLKFCSYAAAITGISTAGVPKVVEAFETKLRKKVVWLHFQECTCCSESFIRSSHPVVGDIILNKLSLDYSETLQATSGHQAEQCRDEAIKDGGHILLVEGAVPLGHDMFCAIGGHSAKSIIQKCAKDADAVIAWGSCASNGCVQAAKPNPTEATPIHEILDNKVIRVPGCPPIAEVMAAVVTHLLVFGKDTIELDDRGRPKEFYSRRVHDTCYRRANYDAGLFVESWDDENAKKGYCLYKMGCRGPETYNACSTTKWNGGVSFPIQSGHGCIGCSEDGFWDNAPLYKQLPDFPGFGIEATADEIGAVATAVVGAGVAGHAIMTNLTKHKVIKEHKDESIDK